MPLQIIRDDIAHLQVKVDAIVTSASPDFQSIGGADGAIHRAAGPGLLERCRRLIGCPIGQARITKAEELDCRYVIHTAAPRWEGGRGRPLLASCYRSSLELAAKKGCQSVAFPLISSGILGCPKDQALRVAVDTVSAFLMEQEMTVYLVVFDSSAYQISARLFDDIAAYIDDRYVAEHQDSRPSRRTRWEDLPLFAREPFPPEGLALEDTSEPDSYDLGYALESLEEDGFPLRNAPKEPPPAQLARIAPEPDEMPDWPEFNCESRGPDKRELEALMKMLDESFSQMLLRKIDERGMTDAQCYKKANIDRRLFSKIRSDPFYKPSKPTVVAFALALELPLPELREMLDKAGFSLSRSSRFDLIVEYFVAHGNYNVFEINEALFAFDQSLIGA